MSGYVEYESNNSGGYWWLKDEDWFALEKAGWHVLWKAKDEYYRGKLERGRWIGALATVAKRKGLSLREAAEEWERITGKSATSPGCPCCGQPHHFVEYNDEGTIIGSGPNTSYECGW